MSSAKEPVTPSANVAQGPSRDAMGDHSIGPDLQYGDPVELSFDAFKYNNFNEEEQGIVLKILNSFHGMKHRMERSLARKLAEFLPKAWDKSRSIPSPLQHPFYKALRGADGYQKKLYYPHWFFLAIRWGPGHASLVPIRKDMAALWGVEFSAIHVSYPADIPLSSQKMLFSGELPNSHSLCEIKTRAQGFKEAIAQANSASVIKAVTAHAPTLLHKAAVTPNNKDVELLKLELKTTREQLQQTRNELHDVRAGFSRLEDMVKAVCDTYTNKITVVEMETARIEERVLELDGDVFHTDERIAELDRRVDKVTDTSALVLSILTAPGGEKRDREEEEAES